MASAENFFLSPNLRTRDPSCARVNRKVDARRKRRMNAMHRPTSLDEWVHGAGGADLFGHGKRRIPAEGERDPGGAPAKQVVEDDLLVNTGAFVAQILDASERELECGVAMNEAGEAFIDHGERITKSDEECRRSRLYAFTLVRLAIAAVITTVAVEAADVRRAGGTRVAELARRGHGELIFAIDRNVSRT